MFIPNRIPFEFYHLAPKNNNINNNGLVSLEYYYQHSSTLYKHFTMKYRTRLIHNWKIYPNIQNEKDLTLDQIHEGINIYRQSEDGNNMIYFFKFLPYKDLGANMNNILKNKEAFKIDIDDPYTKTFIKEIQWGYWLSDSRNRKLNRHYYQNIDEDEYFSKYNDNDKILFKNLNHIAIIPKKNFLPRQILEKVEIE